MVLWNPPECTLMSASADTKSILMSVSSGTKSVLMSVCADTRLVQCLLLRGYWDFLLSAVTSCELTESEEIPPQLSHGCFHSEICSHPSFCCLCLLHLDTKYFFLTSNFHWLIDSPYALEILPVSSIAQLVASVLWCVNWGAFTFPHNSIFWLTSGAPLCFQVLELCKQSFPVPVCSIWKEVSFGQWYYSYLSLTGNTSLTYSGMTAVFSRKKFYWSAKSFCQKQVWSCLSSL